MVAHGREGEHQDQLVDVTGWLLHGSFCDESRTNGDDVDHIDPVGLTGDCFRVRLVAVIERDEGAETRNTEWWNPRRECDYEEEGCEQ